MQLRRYARFRSERRLSGLALAVVLLAGSAACGRQGSDWEGLNEAAARALREGRSMAAEEHLLQALELAGAEAGESSRYRLSLHRLARFYEARQRYTQAAEFYAQALEVDSRRLKVDDPSLYDTVKRLAGVYETLQQVADAKEVYRRFLAQQEAQLGPDVLPVATTLVRIGRLARMRAAYDEAEDSFQRALSIRIRHLGQDNELLPEILDEYVILLRETEQPYRAELMEERAARLRMNRTARRMNDPGGN